MTEAPGGHAPGSGSPESAPSGSASPESAPSGSASAESAPSESAPSGSASAESASETVDASILPLGSLGIIGPMNSLGFALNPGLGLVYDEVIVLLPAQALVFSFQQRKAADAAREMPYDEAARREGVRVIRLDDIVRAELVRPFTGYRLVMEVADDVEQRWILQNGDVDEVRQVLAKVLGDRFVDSST